MSTHATAIDSNSPPADPAFPRKHRVPVLGHAVALLTDPLGALDDWAKEKGDLYRVKLIWNEAWIVNRPSEIERILTSAKGFRRDEDSRRLKHMLGDGVLTAEGSLWMRERRLLQPAFHRDRIAEYARVMVDLGAAEFDRWQSGPRDFNHDMMGLTLRIASATLFGDGEGEVDAEEVGRALHHVMHRFSGATWLAPLWAPLPKMRAYHRAVERLDQLVRGVITRRRSRGGAGGKDLLSMLLHVQDEDGSRMTDTQLRDEVLTLLIAGHETTAVALTWTGHLLSHHPEVQAKLHEEARSLAGPPTASDYPRLKYAEAVLQESMRLYPPAWAMGREVVDGFQLAGHDLPDGARVIVTPYSTHRDPRFFHDPLAFRPERWMDGSLANLPPYAYFAFGGGQRMCIGKGFAMMEGVLLLAELARRFAFHPKPGFTPVPFPAITLRPRDGLHLVIERRTPEGARA
ncbi:MAG TPA: cytochrome P450 [Myxococcaceae bacterium]|nr:cytochrome P450 [Myxococcaceae bacterium]